MTEFRRQRPWERRPRSAVEARQSNTDNEWAGDICDHAAEVIAKVDRQHPADQVLRAMSRNVRQRDPIDAGGVARAVFSYFRWRGWLDSKQLLVAQVEDAVQLAERFVQEPERFRDKELLERAVPGWTKQEVEVEPAWVRSLQAEPRLWLRARRGQGPALAEKLGNCRIFGSGLLADTLEYRGTEDLFRTPEFHAGEFEVQDFSSQAVGFICAPRPGETWWDACAGEGGKALHLSDLMENQGLIWATDRSAWRLQQLKRRTARAKVFNYRAALWVDGARLPTKTRFDGVLVDAPCCGLGTWQRNPHARWTTTLEDVQELATLQSDLLAKVAAAVKPGGRLIYSVCTLARSETTAVADKFEAAFSEFEPVVVPTPWKPDAASHPRLLLWPQEFGGNGMFVAVWKRRA